MNTNDLPLAQKLAALMEAGMAANPGVKHVNGAWGDGKTAGCAMTYAMLGAGLEAEGGAAFHGLADYLGVPFSELESVAWRVIAMNDNRRASMPEILEAVRTDTLPKSATPQFTYMPAASVAAWQKLAEAVAPDMQKVMPTNLPSYWCVSTKDSAIAWDIVGGGKPKKLKAHKPLLSSAAKVRRNTKTGATWPVARGAYA